MYSILILNSSGSYDYVLDDDSAVWTGTKAEAQTKVGKLLATTLITKIKVVHNVTITETITLADVEDA